jgi:hypothetical protein
MRAWLAVLFLLVLLTLGGKPRADSFPALLPTIGSAVLTPLSRGVADFRYGGADVHVEDDGAVDPGLRAITDCTAIALPRRIYPAAPAPSGSLPGRFAPRSEPWSDRDAAGHSRSDETRHPCALARTRTFATAFS